MRVRKATAEEKAQYAVGNTFNNGAKPLYPLYGFIKVSGVDCAVEDLRGRGAADDPRYEVMAPDGKHFTEQLHTLLCANLEDLYTRVAANDLEDCTKEC
jgi:hypothetical protein